MGDPLVARGMDIDLGAKGTFIGFVFGSLVHDRALRPRERGLVVLALDEVLPDLGSDEFKQKTQVSNDGVVSKNCVVLLLQVMHAKASQKNKEHQLHCALRKQEELDQRNAQASKRQEENSEPNGVVLIESFKHMRPLGGVLRIAQRAGCWWRALIEIF